MDNLEEMDKFLEKYNFPKLNQEEIENLNRFFSGTTSSEALLPLLISTGGSTPLLCLEGVPDLQSTYEKHWAGGSTSWNQDCWEKYE